jgi:cysteinyl-tRNA synthetase
MSMRYLGESFDVHGGGLDLVFPHHENEIAQSEAASGKPMCRLWVHGGFLEVNKEKMSKSLGNFLTAREYFAFGEPEALRYLMLTVHYRGPLSLDWTRDVHGQVTGCPQLEDAERRVEYVYRTRARLEAIPEARLAESGEVDDGLTRFPQRLADALDDDLNMPVGLAHAAEFLKQVNELAERAKGKKATVSSKAVQAAHEGFGVLARVLGLGNGDAEPLLLRVRKRRAERLGLREARDFARADAIRDEIAGRGIELMDGPDGTTWRIP